MDLNRRFTDNEPCWLIKVDTKISGPWSFNEVLVKLMSGELRPHHEAHSPQDRWRSLQSQPLFSAAIERLKKQNEDKGGSGDENFTRTERSQFTRTVELSSTDALRLSSNESVTPPPVFKASTPAAPAPVFKPLEAPPKYTAPVEKSSSMWPLVLVTLLLLAAGGTFLFWPNKKAEIQVQKNQFLETVDKGLALKKNAEWYDALKTFKIAYQMNPKDVDLVFEMAPLLVQVENQTMYARTMMEKTMMGQYKKENLWIGKNILGLSYAYESQDKMALKYFDEVLKDEEVYYPALVNKGYTLFLSGQYGPAGEALRDAVRGPSIGVIPTLYLVENYIFEGVKSDSKTAFEKAFALAEQASGQFLDGQQELLLFQAFAALKLGRDANYVQSILQNSLLMDPDQTADHLHSPLIDWRGLQWSQFAFICNEFSRIVKPDVNSLLEFVCTYKTHNEMAAQQSVNGWMARSQRHPWPNVAQAIVSYRLGEYEKAKVSLGIAKSFGATDKLYYQTLIKVCGKLHDLNCLRANYDTVAKMSPLHAFTAKAIEGRLTSGNNKQAVMSGLRESSNYIPLIKLQ